MISQDNGEWRMEDAGEQTVPLVVDALYRAALARVFPTYQEQARWVVCADDVRAATLRRIIMNTARAHDGTRRMQVIADCRVIAHYKMLTLSL